MSHTCNATDYCSCMSYPSFTSIHAMDTLADSGVTPLLYFVLLVLIGLIVTVIAWIGCLRPLICGHGGVGKLTNANINRINDADNSLLPVVNKSPSGISGVIGSENGSVEDLESMGMRKRKKKRIKYVPHNVFHAKGRNKHKDQIVDAKLVKMVNQYEWGVGHDSDPRIEVFLSNHVELFDRIFEGNVDYEEVSSGRESGGRRAKRA